MSCDKTFASFYYLKGTQVDVTLTIPECTWIANVRWGSTELGTSPGGDVDSPAAHFTYLSERTLADGRRRVTVRITTRAWTNGDSERITLTVKTSCRFLETEVFPEVEERQQEVGERRREEDAAKDAIRDRACRRHDAQEGTHRQRDSEPDYNHRRRAQHVGDGRSVGKWQQWIRLGYGLRHRQ
jgi:hypothetical protein